MIYKALQLIKEELHDYLKPLKGTDAVVLGNIAYLDSNLNGGSVGGVDLHSNIVLSLIRIEEEKILKNAPNYEKSNGKTIYKNSPVPLNLYLLFTVGTNETNESYMKTTLEYLAKIIKLFQSKNIFTNVNTPHTIADTEGELDYFKLILDLYSPSFEEANYMWGTLGGRQLPHVCYKMRMIQLERKLIQEERGTIKEIVLEDQNI